MIQQTAGHPNRTAWHIGQRASRKTNSEFGTVVESDGSIKVKWDTGEISFFRRGVSLNEALTDE